jgi:hypothetical protein
MTQEALKLALEALKAAQELAGKHDAELEYGFQQAITAIKEALAQPEQKPVAYLCEPDENGLFGLPTSDKGCKDCFPVYRQRTWVGLAAEDRLTAKYMQDAPDGIDAVIDYIETKLKEKNCAG